MQQRLVIIKTDQSTVSQAKAFTLLLSDHYYTAVMSIVTHSYRAAIIGWEAALNPL